MKGFKRRIQGIWDVNQIGPWVELKGSRRWTKGVQAVNQRGLGGELKGSRHINWVLRNNSSVHSVAVAGFCDALVLTASAMTMTSSFFIVPWERVSWLFLLDWSRSLGFLELFSNSPFERHWSLLTRSSLLLGHYENHLIWVDAILMALLELSLVIECFWPLLTQSSLPAYLSQENLIWLDSIWTVPLGLHADFPLELLLRRP